MKTRRILAAAACLIVIGAAVFFLTRRTRAERVTEFLASAGRFEEQNDYESAIITLRNALRLAPGNARIHAGLAQDYAMINKALSSLKHYNAALRLGRRDPQFLTDYAETCVRFNAISELAEPAAKLLEARPDDPDAHFWMARSLAANRPHEAILHVQQSLSKRPYEKAYLLHADLLAQDRNFAKAGECLQDALGKLPGKPQLMAALAAVELHLDHHDQARERIRQALAAVESANAPEKIPVLRVAGDVYGRLRMNDRSIEIFRELVGLDPENISFQMLLARRYMAAGRLEEARDLLLQTIEKDPENDDLRVSLAEVLLKSQEPRAAREHLARLSVEAASSAPALYLMGSVFMALDDPWQAEPLFKRARDAAPGMSQVQIALGICHWRLGLVRSAESEFEAALRDMPNNAGASIWLARCKLASGDLREAERLANNVLAEDENNQEARRILISCKAQGANIEELEHLMQINDHARAAASDLLIMAGVLTANGHTDRALAMLETVIAKAPDLLDAPLMKAKILEVTDKKTEAETLLRSLAAAHPQSESPAIEYARFLDRAGREDDAHSVLANLTERLPESSIARRALAEHHRHTGNLDKAAASFRVAMQLDPKNIAIRRGLVYVLLEKGDLDLAREETERAKADFGEAMTVLEFEGMLLLQQGKADQAIACFMSLIGRWPSEPRGHVLLGAAHSAKEDLAAAITALETARDLAPRDAAVRGHLRDAFLAAGLYDRAAEEARQAMALGAGTADDVHKFAISLAGSKETDTARNILEKLSAIVPEKAEYHVQLAMLLSAEGKTEQAEQEFRRALDIEKTPATLWPACGFYWHANRYKAAADLIESIAGNNPNLYHTLMARHYTVVGDPAKAEAEHMEMIRAAHADPMPLCALGDFYAAQPGRFDAAAEAYRKALELDAGLLYAHLRIALLFAKAGKLDDAEMILTPLAKKHPHNADVWARLAEVAIQRMRRTPSKAAADVALERSTRFAERFPHLAQAHHLITLARLFADPPDRRGARASLERTLAIVPGHAEALILRARLHLDDGRLPEAEEDCRKLLNEQRGNNEAMLLLGAILVRKNTPPNEYQKLTEEFPDNTAARLLLGLAICDEAPDRSARLLADVLGESPPWDLLKEYCKFLLAREQPGKAISALQTFVDRDRTSTEARRLLADAHAGAGDLAAAVREQRRAYELAGRNFGDLQRTVSVLMKARTPADALALIREHIAARPDDNAARLLLAQVLGESGGLDEAVAEAAGLVEEEPENLRAHLILATAYMLQRRFGEAVTHYETVLMRDPANRIAGNNLAFILAEHLGRPRDAERVILPAVQRFPDSASIQDTYGWTMYKVGKLNDARKALEKSLKLGPDEPATMFHLAVVCEQLKDPHRARELLRGALKLDADFENADEARRLLATLE
ncbi:MAG: tetratricopeptide repeat protein [Planctomycetes bacterium]|nr:tetratricopeptide repeat protein [Planctomycetota bacterium]